MGLAFWLVPSDDARAVLAEEMEKLRSNSPDAPRFESHATLLAGFGSDNVDPDELLATAKSAVDAWKEDQGSSKGLTCLLEDVTTRGMYFQCILIALHKHDHLLSLNTRMRKAFGLEAQPPFFPHISLLYSDIDADEARRQIAAMEQHATFSRRPAGGIDFAGLSQVDFVGVDLYDCNGPPDQWHRLGSIPL